MERGRGLSVSFQGGAALRQIDRVTGCYPVVVYLCVCVCGASGGRSSASMRSNGKVDGEGSDCLET